MAENQIFRRVQIDTGTVSRTEQHHKESCDIRFIMAQFERTGMIDHVAKHQAQYGSLVGKPDYLEAMNIVANANSMFESIPAQIRARFQNKAENFLEFIQDEENREEMGELGFSTNHLPELQEAPKESLEVTPEEAAAASAVSQPPEEPPAEPTPE